MRRRSFVPEAPSRLEGRALLSGGARPVHLSAPLFNVSLLQIKGDFEQFALSGDIKRLKSQLYEISRPLPFKKADQLGPKTNAILDRMRANLAANVPNAVATAYQQTVDGIKASIIRHIEDGTLVVNDR